MTSLRPATAARDLARVLADAGIPASAPTVLIGGVTHDSSGVLPGDLFVARPGLVTHGAAYAADAVARGAVAIATDALGAEMIGECSVPVVVIADPRAALGPIAAEAYGRPAGDLLMLGVTGTNGKTTTAALMGAGLAAAGHRVGIIGTAGIFVDGETLPSARTTPEASDLQAILAVMRERGITAVAMEVSSHALALHRVDGVVYDVACFTNLSMDHLDFHGTMEAYFEAKAQLFTAAFAQQAVIGVDDEWGRRLADTVAIPSTTWSLDGSADWRALGVRTVDAVRQMVSVAEPDGSEVDLALDLPGRFNAANAVAAYAVLRTCGVAADVLRHAFASVHVPGRMEVVPSRDGVTYLVDYAHSPDAVSRVLAEARPMAAGRVIAVLGCGGDRDRDKRPIMGEIASSLADVVIVTDDNPRSEDPATIRASILSGITGSAVGVDEMGDRREAIRHAVRAARPGDVVAVLGKGHETGQEISGVVHPFDDRAELRAAIEEARA